VTRVSYQFQAGDAHLWKTSVFLGRELQEVAQRPLVPPIEGCRWGIVRKKAAEPSKIPAFEVWVPDLDRYPDHTVLATWSTPYAGKHRAMCFYPQDGNRVLLAFVENNPCLPVIVNAAPNADNPVPLEPDETRMKTGFFWDDGKETFEWSFDAKKRESRLALKKDGDAKEHVQRINQDTGLHFETGQTISMSADTDVKVSAQKDTLELKMGEQGIAATAKKGKVDIKNMSTELTLEAQKLSLKSVEVEATGTQQSTLKGASSTLTVSAQALKLDGLKVKVEGAAGVEIQSVNTEIKP
jgi:uncharacterized protein involved in type VI secretion and phage assembly